MGRAFVVNGLVCFGSGVFILVLVGMRLFPMGMILGTCLTPLLLLFLPDNLRNRFIMIEGDVSEAPVENAAVIGGFFGVAIFFIVCVTGSFLIIFALIESA